MPGHLLRLCTNGVCALAWDLWVKQMPGNCDLSYLLASQTRININWSNLTVEQRLKDQRIQKRKRELRNAASCDLYAKFHRENDLLLEKSKVHAGCL